MKHTAPSQHLHQTGQHPLSICTRQGSTFSVSAPDRAAFSQHLHQKGQHPLSICTRQGLSLTASGVVVAQPWLLKMLNRVSASLTCKSRPHLVHSRSPAETWQSRILVSESSRKWKYVSSVARQPRVNTWPCVARQPRVGTYPVHLEEACEDPEGEDVQPDVAIERMA